MIASAPDPDASVPGASHYVLHDPTPRRDRPDAEREATARPSSDAATIEIDARIVAEGLGLAPEEVEPCRQAGKITTLCERGTGEDAGWLRATFYYGKRRLRLLVDPQGRVQQPLEPDQPNR